MTNSTLLRDALDELDSGIPDAPDLVGIRRRGRRMRRHRRLTWGVGVAAVLLGAAGAAMVMIPDVRPSVQGVSARPLTDGPYVVLDNDTWAMTQIADGSGMESATFEKNGQQLEIQEYPDDLYANRQSNYQGLRDVHSITVLGHSATMGKLGPVDYTALLPPQDGTVIELRGSGMGAVAFELLLGELSFTDAIAFASAAPDGTVTPANHNEKLAELLRDVDVPPGFSAADIQLEGVNSRAVAASAVAGQVGCAWIDVYAQGPSQSRSDAVAAFESGRNWPVMSVLAKVGDFPQVFSDIGDDLRRGTTVSGDPLDLENLKSDLGC